MASDKYRNEFTLSFKEQCSREMVFIAFTILESRGYPGFTQLLQILNDPTTILKIIRFLYGMEIKVPPLTEFAKCLKAAEYIFCDMHKRINANLVAKPKDIRHYLNIDDKEEKELLDIFDQWSKYMSDNGIDLTKLMHMNRENTKKSIKMTAKSKKWKGTKY